MNTHENFWNYANLYSLT